MKLIQFIFFFFLILVLVLSLAKQFLTLVVKLIKTSIGDLTQYIHTLFKRKMSATAMCSTTINIKCVLDRNGVFLINYLCIWRPFEGICCNFIVCNYRLKMMCVVAVAVIGLLCGHRKCTMQFNLMSSIK